MVGFRLRSAFTSGGCRRRGDLGDVDIAVACAIMPRSFFAVACRRGELGDGAARRGLRRLATGVRVDLGVEDEDVDVAAGREDVVQAAEADVVGPAVAADDPDDFSTSSSASIASVARPVVYRELLLQLGDVARCAAMPPRRSGRRVQRLSSSAGMRRRAVEQPPGLLALVVERQAACRSRTRRCPRRASSPRRGRGRRRSSSTASSAGCRRRSTSSRSRSRRAAGRRTAA